MKVVALPTVIVTITNDKGRVLSQHLVMAVDPSLDEEEVLTIVEDALPSTSQVEVEELTPGTHLVRSSES